jgi:hypothetical protein
MRFLEICLIVSVAAAADFAQSSAVVKSVKADGWRLPNLRRLTVADRSDVDSNRKIIEKRVFELSRSKPTIKLRRYTYCEFRNLSSYSYRKRLITIDGICVVLIVRDNIRRYQGAITRFTFVDEDGDGKMETRYTSSPGDQSFRIPFPSNLDDH